MGLLGCPSKGGRVPQGRTILNSACNSSARNILGVVPVELSCYFQVPFPALPCLAHFFRTRALQIDCLALQRLGRACLAAPRLGSVSDLTGAASTQHAQNLCQLGAPESAPG